MNLEEQLKTMTLIKDFGDGLKLYSNGIEFIFTNTDKDGLSKDI